MQPATLSILGVGLLGGSIGLALRAISSPCKIMGYGHRSSTLRLALEVGAIDQGYEDLASAVRESELIILCTPVGVFSQILGHIAPHLKSGAIVADVGSTKQTVVAQAARLLPKHVHFVGSHPMAGSEKRGVEFARADLFQGALCLTTPTPATDAKALEAVESFWQSIGMRIKRLTPQQHDQWVGEISHLPHAVAAALIEMQRDDALALAGKGFLDATRIAGGDGALWRDIFLDNRDNLRSGIARLKSALDRLDAMLAPEHADALRDWLNASSLRREKLLQQKLKELNPD